MEPEFQNQHRLPQVYLKNFAYQEKGKWFISIIEFGVPFIQHEEVQTFTAEVNIFDFLILDNIDDRRHFENLCQKIEVKYPLITKSIKGGSLSDEQFLILCEFMATLVARTESQRVFYMGLLSHPASKNKFITELSTFNPRTQFDLNIISWEYSIDDTVRIASFLAGEHFARCFTFFTYIVLQAPSGKYWPTSDDPVTIDNQGQEGVLISLDSEIYFPITKHFCLFMYSDESSIKNHPLRGLTPRAFHICDEVSHGFICLKIAWNAHHYTILPEKLNAIFPEIYMRHAFVRIR